MEADDLSEIQNLLEKLRICRDSLCSEKEQDELLAEIHKLYADLVINPEKIIDAIESDGYSIFHTLQAWIADSSNITNTSIKKNLTAALPNYIHTMSVDIQSILSNTINVMVNTIVKVVHGNCKPIECNPCILKRHCPLRCN